MFSALDHRVNFQHTNFHPAKFHPSVIHPTNFQLRGFLKVRPILLLILVLLSNNRACAVETINALLVIDVQNCFLPGGPLAVKDGEKVIPVINDIRLRWGSRFTVIVLSQDYHCYDHVSFASQHGNYSVFDEISLEYLDSGELCRTSLTGNKWYTVDCAGNKTKTINQILWPDHCVMNTTGSLFSKELETAPTDFIVQKGYRCQVDSYSAFFDNGGFTHTQLHDELSKRGVTTVYVVGLATDYCVKYTALDAVKLGYKTYAILDATRGVADATTKAAVKEMQNSGVSLINSTSLDETFSGSVASTFSATYLILPSVSIIFIFCKFV